jgi:hypothetical protein
MDAWIVGDEAAAALMCTVAVRVGNDDRWQVCLVAVRDELYSRATLAPAAHWPECDSDLLGALDLQAGGTALAVHRGRRAVAVVVNAEPHVTKTRNGCLPPTRGTLPLLAAAGQKIPPSTLREMPGFHLLIAAADGSVGCETSDTEATGVEIDVPPCGGPTVQLLSWNGRELTRRFIDRGDHVLVSAGLDVAAHTRAERVRVALARVPRYAPPDSSLWRPVTCAGVVEDQQFPAGRYGTVGATAVALSPRCLHYSVCTRPARPAWVPVKLDGSARQSPRGAYEDRRHPRLNPRPRGQSRR